MKTKNIIIWVVVLMVIVIAAVFLWLRTPLQVSQAPAKTGDQTSVRNLIATASYSCDGGKTIIASYYAGSSTPPAAPNEPPHPGGSVDIALSDGRAMTLPQTISADGGRYANADESLIFWSKGNGAFVMENGTTTYTNCNQNS